MKKICIPLTSRGNYAKMRQFILELQRLDSVEPIVVIAGALLKDGSESIIKYLNDNGIIVSSTVDYLSKKSDLPGMVASSANALEKFGKLFSIIQPDYVMIIADRYECLPIAVAASYQNIKICHVEGGEVTGTIDESIRHAVTKMSHLHFVANKDAAKRVINLGEHADYVTIVGSTSFDAINALKDLTFDFNQLKPLLKNDNFDPNTKYVLVILHPVTTSYLENSKYTKSLIEALLNSNEQVLWIESNVDAGSDLINEIIEEKLTNKFTQNNFYFLPSLPIELYAPLLNNAACIIGNSSSGIREAGFLGVPSINIGERQSGRMTQQNVINVEADSEQILSALNIQINHGQYARENTYGEGFGFEKMITAIIEDQSPLQKQISY